MNKPLFAHPSQLIRWAGPLYILHVLLICKIALGMLSAFCVFGLVTWAVARRDIRFSGHILYFPLALYGLVSSVSAIAAERHIHEDLELTLWFKILIFPSALILLRELPALRERLIPAFVLFGGGMAVWGLIEYVFLGQRDLEHRINGPSSHVMTYSGLILPFSLMFLLMWWHRRKWWQLAVGVLITVALLLTLTRSVWLAWAAAILVILVMTRSKLRYYLYILPALLLFLTFMPMSLFGRLMSTFDMTHSSNFDRLRMLEAGVEIIKDYPLLGVGPANVKEIYALYKKHDAPRPRPAHLHNNLVQLWAERGILGMAAYLLFFVLFLRECAKGWRGPNRMWAQIGVATAVAFFVAGLFEFNFGDTEVFYLNLNLFAFICVALEQPEPLPNEVAPSLVPALA